MSSKNDNVGRRIKAARTGLVTGLPQGTKSLKVGDQTYTLAEIDQALAELEKLFDAVTAARAALNRRVDERNVKIDDARVLLADFELTIRALLGRTNEKLVEFGINPERPRKGDRKAKADRATPAK